MFIGIDAEPSRMAEYSRRATRKPAKGGVANALFVYAPLERLPWELAGAASEVHVNLPRGSLLKAVALPDGEGLRAIRSLCEPGARVTVVIAYDAARDAKLGLSLQDCLQMEELAFAYEQAGFAGLVMREISFRSLRDLPSTWAKRLAYGRRRTVWEIKARAA
jgi:16S rRNA (adenine(1408)-N(1))-methyltransferase